MVFVYEEYIDTNNCINSHVVDFPALWFPLVSCFAYVGVYKVLEYLVLDYTCVGWEEQWYERLLTSFQLYTFSTYNFWFPHVTSYVFVGVQKVLE